MMAIIGSGGTFGSYKLYTATRGSAQNVHWKLRSMPSGAQVLDSQDHLLGITPLDAERPPQPGSIDLVLRYKDHFDKKLSLDGDRDADREETLVPMIDKNIQIFE